MEYGIITINFDKLHNPNDYEWKYAKIIQKGLYYPEGFKYRRIKDIESYDIGDDKYKEIHFTVVRRHASHRMVVLGQILEMRSRDL